MHTHGWLPDKHQEKDDVVRVFETVLNSEDRPASGPIPGSVVFHYRNHPHLLRMTRHRANRHGEHLQETAFRPTPFGPMP